MLLSQKKIKYLLAEAILEEAGISPEKLAHINKLLNDLNNLFKQYNLPEITKGLTKASKMASGVKGGMSLRFAWASAKADEDEMKDLLSGYSKIVSLENALIQGLKRLPSVIALLDKQENPTSPLNPQNPLGRQFNRIPMKQVKKAIANAFRPAGKRRILGLPFINDGKFADELLDMDYQEILDLTEKAKGMKPAKKIVPKVDVPEEEKVEEPEEEEKPAKKRKVVRKVPKKKKREEWKPSKEEFKKAKEGRKKKILRKGTFIRFAEKEGFSVEDARKIVAFLRKRGIDFK